MTASVKKTWFIIGGAFAALIVFGLIARAAGWIGGEPEGTLVETARVERKTITQRVSASGTVRQEV